MDLSQLVRESERLRAQIADEPDPSLQREMKKTFTHYQKQIRIVTKHRTPWYGVKTNFVFLVILFLLTIWACLALGLNFGVGNLPTALFVATIVLVLVSAMTFVVLRIISPDTYRQIVTVGINAVAGQETLQSDKTESHPRELPTGEAKQLPANSSSPMTVDQTRHSKDAIRNSGTDRAPRA